MATLTPGRGGVGAMLASALELLAERNLDVVAAWYEGYSVAPELSVPLFRLGSRRPRSASRQLAGAREALALGAWFPELEFMHYFPRRAWRELIAGCDLHTVVSGNCLPGWLLERTGRPFFGWIASDWWGDRKDRVACFPAPRRWLDRWLVRPVARRIERRILRAGYVLALSQATQRELERVAGGPVVRAVLPVPVNLERFHPRPDLVVQGRIGLAGRFDDPRKNVGLFLSALAEARERGARLTGVLIGASESPALSRAIERLGLAGSVEILGDLPAERYAEQLRTLDLLVVTSHQEGLHVSALEAMASGCPVVSTRCGGPEEFVADGENGWLTDFDPHEVAGRMAEVTNDRETRARMSAAASATVARGYSWERVRATFLTHFDAFSAESARARSR